MDDNNSLISLENSEYKEPLPVLPSPVAAREASTSVLDSIMKYAVARRKSKIMSGKPIIKNERERWGYYSHVQY